MEWPAFLRQNRRTDALSRYDYLEKAKSTRYGADERFFISSSANLFLVLVSERKQKIFIFFSVLFLDSRGMMEVSGTSGSFMFVSPFSTPGGSKAIVSKARDTINAGGQSRAGTNAFTFKSNSIQERSEKTQLSIVDDIERNSRFSDLKVDRLNELRDSLQTLRTTVNVFRNTDAFNLVAADSSRQDLVKIKAGIASPTEKFTVTPTKKAINNTLVSDEQSKLDALGLSGNFYINGFKVSVETTDSIFDLKDKINYGEDTNKNNRLDRAEDTNNNGTLDIIKISANEFGEGLYLTEDRNGNKMLDPSEDTINNGRLDGGTQQNRVRANVIDNRLTLKSFAGGSTRIDLRDDDNVLLKLGFFELNLKGLPVQKELQFDNEKLRQGIRATNLNAEPQPALAEVDKTFNDPKIVASDFNKFINIAENSALTLEKESTKMSNVQIFFDATNALDQIKLFFNQFNDSLREINDILFQSKEFYKDKEIQKIRDELTFQPQDKTRVIEKRNEIIDIFRSASENLQTIGFSIKNDFKNPANQLTSTGIRTIDDSTFVIDETKLKKSLEVNSGETLKIFTDEETGLLPLLSQQLENLLRKNTGDLDQKLTQIQTNSSAITAEKFRKFTNISTLNNTVKNLIAVA